MPRPGCALKLFLFSTFIELDYIEVYAEHGGMISLYGKKPECPGLWLGGRSPHGFFFRKNLRPTVGVLHVCRACTTAWKWESSPNLMEVKGSRAQGHRRETVSEGSAEQMREPMDKNRIRGVDVGRASV